MAIPVLIIGKSGMGKSASLRNCAGNPDWNLIRVLNKPLPFKGKIDGWNTDDYQTVMKCLIQSKAKNIVIDDAGYLITNMFMSKHSAAGGGNGVFTLYNQIGDHFWNLIQFIIEKVPADKMNAVGGKGLTETEQKKEYLKEYEKAVRQMKRSEEKITEMRLSKIMPSAGNDGMPHAHNNTDLSGYAALLDEEERRYMKARYHRIKLCREITDKIERMDNEDEKDVLMYRYIRLMKWEDIAVKMEYSWQHLHKIHARALHNFKI